VAYRRLLDKEPEKARTAVHERMQYWLQDKDFAGVRGPEALAKLPKEECQEWQKLWADVADTLARTERKAAPKPVPLPRKESRRGGRSLDLVDRVNSFNPFVPFPSSWRRHSRHAL